MPILGGGGKLTSGLSFGSQVESWVQESQVKMRAVFQESVQELVSKAQSRIPIDTGFARASIRGSLTRMPSIDPKAAPASRSVKYPDRTGEVVVQIASAQLGDTIYVGWTANYVILLEYGSSMQAPLGFVGISAIEWPDIVERVTRELASRIGRA